MLLSEKIAFIAIGQAGGNIVKDLENVTKELFGVNDINSFYINSSLDDLDACEAPLDKRYHISGSKGMAKDQDYAFEIITSNENDGKIADAIYNKYANPKIYFLVGSSSGATCGGTINQIGKKLKEFYDDKIINAIIVKPHKDEDMKMQYNSKKCLTNIKQNIEDGIFTNVQELDNNKFEFGKKLELNKRYVRLLSKIIHLDVISKEGNLDEEELERLFTRVGLLSFHEIQNSDFKTNISNYDNNSMFFKTKKTPQTHGLILNSNNNNSESLKLIRENFGIPLETHSIYWDEETNIVISSGMEFDDNIFIELDNSYNELKNMRDEINSKNNTIEETKSINVDYSDMTEQRKQPKETVITGTSQLLTRGRRGKKLQGQLNK